MTGPVTHTLPPIYGEDARVLILGTMPSPKSRETGFYYSHPQNRFWTVLAAILKEPLPKTTEEKTALLLRRRIALWDVLQSCTIEGADDGSIRCPKANDIASLLEKAPVHAIFTTGGKAASLYKKLCLPLTGRPALPLPSTSPANCRYYTLQGLIDAYRAILFYL